MIALPEQPALRPPTEAVRLSYLTGSQASARFDGADLGWLEAASRDFGAYVAARRGVRERWGVPSTLYWYVAGEHYLGGLVIRHRLTPDLEQAGGHIGYDIAYPWRRQGHATRMLAEGLERCRDLGLTRVLITCAVGNEWSRRVILANGGVANGQALGEDRFWIELAAA